MSKYIVKNCPCFVLGIAMKGNDKKVQTCNNHKTRELTYCKDCTDCVIKQVIEKCKDSKLSYNKLEILRTACETNQAYGKAVMAEQILQLLDIEEVRE